MRGKRGIHPLTFSLRDTNMNLLTLGEREPVATLTASHMTSDSAQ